MQNKIYWLWLQKCVGIGYKVKPMLEYFGDAKSIYDATIAEKEASGLFNKSKQAKIILENMQNIQLDHCDDILNTCKKYKIHVLTPSDEFYPKSILDIDDFPCVIYARGDITCLNDKNKITVIGTRNPSDYGKESAKTIVSGLTEKGVTLVSGGAIGVDSIAHQGAIDAKTKTILVMACGHGCSYLPENAELRKNVSQNGVLITELPPHENACGSYFKIRNRLMSALSRGTIIIEAALRSGTLITARHSKEQGRPVFVLPGDIKSNRFYGSNNLIKNGAIPIFSAQEVLEHFNIERKNYVGFNTNEEVIIQKDEPFNDIKLSKKTVTKNKNKKEIKTQVLDNDKKLEQIKEETQVNQEINLDGLSNNAKIVYSIINIGVYQLDEITRKAGLPINKVLVSLTELELSGLVVCLGANKYGLK